MLSLTHTSHRRLSLDKQNSPCLWVSGTECVSEAECVAGGWMTVGPACDVHTVTGAVPDVFLLSCFLFIGTFGIAYAIKAFRTSSYFPAIVSTHASRN